MIDCYLWSDLSEFFEVVQQSITSIRNSLYFVENIKFIKSVLKEKDIWDKKYFCIPRIYESTEDWGYSNVKSVNKLI